MTQPLPYSHNPAYVALGLVRHIGGKTLKALLAHFNGDANAVLAADESDLRQVSGVGTKIAAGIKAVDVAAVEAAITRWRVAGATILTLDDSAYPSALKTLPDAPPLLFVMGDLPKSPFKAAAVIGRRRIDKTTQELVNTLAATVAESGYVVVSGLAYGVDHAAHQGALSARDGRTLAVLGGGVLNIYPREHRELAEAIKGRGALLCEVAPEAGVNAAALVARNRIITGLCEAVIVVETEIDGGAMHAARFAKAQGRRLYALDLPASGNRALITAGAEVIPVKNIEDGFPNGFRLLSSG